MFAVSLYLSLISISQYISLSHSLISEVIGWECQSELHAPCHRAVPGDVIYASSAAPGGDSGARAGRCVHVYSTSYSLWWLLRAGLWENMSMWVWWWPDHSRPSFIWPLWWVTTCVITPLTNVWRPGMGDIETPPPPVHPSVRMFVCLSVTFKY